MFIDKNSIGILHSYQCKEENCKHLFFTTSSESLLCPNCGENSLEYQGNYKAIINPSDRVTSAMLGLKESDSLVDFISDYFKEKGLEKPKSIKITLGKEWEDDEYFYEYLSGVNIEGEYIEKEALEKDLEELIDDNYSIESMKNNLIITF